ncbi:hypothetical protein ANCCEY_11065 [Ancylostoma ceylanicum]|uniref:Uncharacterized protein n=1 Tax=Ancylostoma ceylanicum TaxID=53326 RepID=A0A0D6LF91_9BILA|nr:hypothetical protein ANCCEY_11065 [Ancylostoma ceylanicum]
MTSIFNSSGSVLMLPLSLKQFENREKALPDDHWQVLLTSAPLLAHKDYLRRLRRQLVAYISQLALRFPRPVVSRHKRDLRPICGVCEREASFINARRRIVQPMIDQSNRAGRAPAVSVFKNRRRNRSDQSPGPSPDLGAGYSPDAAAAVTMPMAYPGADIYNMQRTMFPTAPYSAFPNPAMANPFMPQMGMMGFPSAGAAPWMDPSLLSSTHGMEG